MTDMDTTEELSHEFEPMIICPNCDDLETDCQCDDPGHDEIDECEVCGMEEADEAHDL